MIAWWWLIVAFVAGDLMGLIAMGICAGGTDKTEEKMRSASVAALTDHRKEV